MQPSQDLPTGTWRKLRSEPPRERLWSICCTPTWIVVFFFSFQDEKDFRDKLSPIYVALNFSLDPEAAADSHGLRPILAYQTANVIERKVFHCAPEAGGFSMSSVRGPVDIPGWGTARQRAHLGEVSRRFASFLENAENRCKKCGEFQLWRSLQSVGIQQERPPIIRLSVCRIPVGPGPNPAAKFFGGDIGAVGFPTCGLFESQGRTCQI